MIFIDCQEHLANREENILGVNFHECNLFTKSKPN